MTDRVGALLAEAPGLERLSHLTPNRLPVLPALEEILPFQGLRPGTTVGITGVGATSLALALIARASEESWTAAVGLPALGLRAASELGVDLDRLVVVPDPEKQWTTVLAALVDAFDVVLVSLGRWPESDLTLQGTSATWHGIGRGHGHLRTRTLDIVVTGRRAAARPRRATLWLPDADGNVSLAQETSVIPIRR